MKSTHTHFYLFLFLFLFPCKSTFAQENIVSDSLEVILPDSVELGDNGFHEVVNEKIIEGESFWEGFGSLHVFFLASGIFFWVALILILVFKLFRYFFK